MPTLIHVMYNWEIHELFYGSSKPFAFLYSQIPQRIITYATEVKFKNDNANADHMQALFYALTAFLKKWASIKKGINEEQHFCQKYGFSVIEYSQPKGVKPRMRERKFISDVNWQGALKQKGVKRGLGFPVMFEYVL